MAYTHNSNINLLDFQEEVMKNVEKFTKLIECTEEQKKIIKLKSEKILV